MTAFIIRATQRRHGGWYDGDPVHIFPSRSEEIAAELTGLCGMDKLMDRSRQLQPEGKSQLAMHLADFAVKGTKRACQTQGSSPSAG